MRDDIGFMWEVIVLSMALLVAASIVDIDVNVSVDGKANVAQIECK